MTTHPNDTHTTSGSATQLSESASDKRDRQFFYLSSFFQTSQELVGLLQPLKILKKFLLMAMGPMGISQGVIALVQHDQRTGNVIGQGIPEESLGILKKNIFQIHEQVASLFAVNEMKTSPDLMGLHQPAYDAALFPFKTTLIFPWAVDENYAGFMAFGEKITKEAFSPEERYLLASLVPLLTASLGTAILTTNVQQLNTELQRKNETLAATISTLRHKEQELDRQVFRLMSIDDINTELRTISRPEIILQSFLLQILGSQGMSQGFILLLNRSSNKLLQVHRGIMPWTDLTVEQTDKILFAALSTVSSKTLEPLTLRHIFQPAFLQEASSSLPIPDQACLFVLDKDTLGVIGISGKIPHDLPKDDSLQFFETQMASFMVYLKNTLAFSTITELNEDLEQRNKDLLSTIDKLTQAHQTIDVMEKAREKIRRTLDRESHRIQRATGFDFILILTAAVLLGILFNIQSPNGISLVPHEWSHPPVPSIELAAVQDNLKTHAAILIDARPQEFFKLGHIPGAINLSPSLFEVMYPMYLEQEDLERPIIIYGRTFSRHYDQDIAYRLESRDHENISIFTGGYTTWKTSTQPISR